MAKQFSINDGRKWKTNFYSMWGGQKLSLLGSTLVSFGIIWYLTEKFQSATILSLATLAGLVPQVILGPFVGPLIDRLDRKKLMIFADGMTALFTFGLSLLFMFDAVEVWHIFVVLFFRSIFGGLHMLSSHSSTTLMVPQEKLVNVSGLDQSFSGAMNIVGGPLGAILLGVIGVRGLLWIDVITAVIAIGILLFVNVPNPDRSAMKDASKNGKNSYFDDLKIGFRYLFSWKGLVILKVGSLTINFLLTPAFAMLAYLTTDHFKKGALELGLMESFFGIGILVMGLIMSAWGGFKSKMRTTTFGLFIMAIGMLLTGFSPEGKIIYGYVTSVLIGIALVFTDAPLTGLMKEIVHPEMQGRLTSIMASMGSLATPVGLMIAGPFSDRFGITWWFLIAGVVYLGLVPVFLMNKPLNSLEEGHPLGDQVEAEFGLTPQTETVSAD